MPSSASIKFAKLGFSNKKYIDYQTSDILERLEKFRDGRLYIEMGGRFPFDAHASRVLPGYKQNNKIKIIQSIVDQADIIFCLNAKDILTNRSFDTGSSTYTEYIDHLLDTYNKSGLPKPFISTSFYTPSEAIDRYLNSLLKRGYKVYKKFEIDGYPKNTKLIASKYGYGQDEYVNVGKEIVIVTGPGSNSGKLSTCLSQLYHESQKGINSGYAKFETFPIWNLELNHPVNLAYEAATADIGDYNAIDPYHRKAYGEIAINYNRDIEAFPIISALINSIVSRDNFMKNYKSPTDMGINSAGYAIIDNDIVSQAAKMEIIRRYFWINDQIRTGRLPASIKETISNIMRKAGTNPSEYDIVKEARRSGKIALQIYENQIELYTTIREIIEKYSSKDVSGALLHSFRPLSNKEKDQLQELNLVFTCE